MTGAETEAGTDVGGKNRSLLPQQGGSGKCGEKAKIKTWNLQRLWLMQMQEAGPKNLRLTLCVD